MADAAFLRWTFAHRPTLAWATTGLTIASGLLEGASLALLVPLLSLVGVPVGDGTDPVAGLVERAFAGLGLPLSLATVLTAFVAFQTVTILVGWMNLRVAARVQEDATLRWRRDIAAAVADAPWHVHVRLRPARIAQALTTDPERVGGAVLMLLRNVASAVLLSVYVLLALRVDWRTTLFVGGVGILLLWLLRRWSALSAREGRAYGQAMHDVHDAAHRWLTGMKLIKLHGDPGDAVLGATRRAARSRVRAMTHQATSSALFQAAAAVLLAVTVAFAAPRLAPASLLFLLFLYARTLPRLNALHRDHLQFRNLLPAHHELLRLQGELRAEHEPPAADWTPPPAPTVELRGVVVDHGGVTVGPLDLTVPGGTTRTLDAPSGSGKTTTLDVAAGILEPTRGEVVVDGLVLDAAHRVAWRRFVGYLPQDPFLLDGTVRENLAWAAPGASSREQERALERAHCGFLLERDGGLDAPVGDVGRRLSGGQRRRVALAMALLRKPALLVLDEPYAGLDAVAAREVEAAVAGLTGVTVVVARHGAD